jgi:phosphopantetheinyl transferase (holo-ACP synthase)
MLSPEHLETLISAATAPYSVRTVVADMALTMADLSKAERAQFGNINPVKQGFWLRGRSALKKLLRAIGEEDDTSNIRFPNAKFSLSHSGDYAIAAAGCDHCGVGIDFELNRSERNYTRAAKFFLSQAELSWLGTLQPPAQERESLRLWNVKEAIFKADLGNAGKLLPDYSLENPDTYTAGKQTIKVGAGFKLMSYSSIDVGCGFFSIATAHHVD